MTLQQLLVLDLAASLSLLAAVTALPAAAALLCSALPPVGRPRPGTLRVALLAAGPARSPTRRELPRALVTHQRGFAARRHGLARLTLMLTAPSTAAVLAAGRLLPWHVTLATPAAVATVTRRSPRTWVLTNFARLPGEEHRGAAAPLLGQILAAGAAAGVEVQLTADTAGLLEYYSRHGFKVTARARGRHRLAMTARPQPIGAGADEPPPEPLPRG